MCMSSSRVILSHYQPDTMASTYFKWMCSTIKPVLVGSVNLY
nr:MAG TPA: hypothetical protein [Caudoviricetes sp.]